MPTSPKKKPTNRVSRSARLRKYEAAYEACLKRTSPPRKKNECKSPAKRSKSRRKPQQKVRSPQQAPIKETRRRSSPKKTEKKVKSKDRKRPLNEYQKFVREESKNTKYKGMSAAERMTAISKVWNDTKI